MLINFNDFNSVVSLFYKQSISLNNTPYLWKKSNNKFISLSWEEIREQVETVAKILINIGILKGDR